MEKKLIKILEEVKRLDVHYQSQIKNKQNQIEILKAEIEQLYEIVDSIQRLGEIIDIELNKTEEVK